jgi:hypothetical protein
VDLLETDIAIPGAEAGRIMKTQGGRSDGLEFEDKKQVLFAIELHSSQPELLVQFYEQLLSLKFKATAYPFTRFDAVIGPIAIIISQSDGCDAATKSEPGKVTFLLLSDDGKLQKCHQRYFVHPKRPLGRALPEHYALRLKDPDGNYVALVASMENVLGSVPTIFTFRVLVECILEYALFRLTSMRNWMRSVVDRTIDSGEYTFDRVAFVSGRFRRYTYVVASREGLFVVNSRSYKRLLRGKFFGVTIRDGAIYCFQSCGVSKGRVLRLRMAEDRIVRVDVIAKGLDDGCHQIDFIGNTLFIVDSANARILEVNEESSECVAHYPFGQLQRKIANEYHMNSLTGHPDGTIWVLLHNACKKYSEVVILDARLKLRRRFSVDAGCAHNIVFTNDESQYLIADSFGGRIITANGVVVDDGLMQPRGISLDEATCVVGDSFFATRPFRRYVPGRVHFFDRISWACTGSLSLPAAPTEIRRVDGRDFSISNFLVAQRRPAAPIGEAPKEEWSQNACASSASVHDFVDMRASKLNNVQ